MSHSQREREFFIDNLLVRIRFIIEIICWTPTSQVAASQTSRGVVFTSYTPAAPPKPWHLRPALTRPGMPLDSCGILRGVDFWEVPFALRLSVPRAAWNNPESRASPAPCRSIHIGVVYPMNHPGGNPGANRWFFSQLPYKCHQNRMASVGG